MSRAGRRDLMLIIAGCVVAALVVLALTAGAAAGSAPVIPSRPGGPSVLFQPAR